MKLSHILIITLLSMAVYPVNRWDDALFVIAFWIIGTLLEQKIDKTTENYSS